MIILEEYTNEKELDKIRNLFNNEHRKTKMAKTKINKEEDKNGFVKGDDGKLQWSLIPFEQLEDVVQVLMNGAKKYSVDNWKKCTELDRYKDALMRHVVSYIKGEKNDNEDNISHLAHAICNCLFLMWFDKNNGDKSE